MAFAYSPQCWELCCNSSDHLLRSGGYGRHFLETVLFSTQLLMAGNVGYVHAFLPSLVPFVAEEIGIEVCVLAQHLQAVHGAFDNPASEIPPRQIRKSYAFAPHRWIWCINGSEHVMFSGGSYAKHCRFACWASAQWFVGAAAGYLHAVCPMLLPTVHENVALELGGLISNRRKLRNLIAQQQRSKGRGESTPDEFSLVNPHNFSDFFSEAFKKRFERASRAADRDADVSDNGQVKVQTTPGSEKIFL